MSAPGHGRVDDVEGAADRCGDDLACEGVVVEDGPDLLHEIHPHVAHVVQAPHEGGDEGRPGLGGQESLGGREDEGHVGPDPLLLEGVGGLEALGRHGDLDDHILVDGRQWLGLGDHSRRVRRDHLRGNGTVHDGAYLLNHVLEPPPALSDEARVGRHAVYHAPGVRGAYLVDDGRIEKDLHPSPLSLEPVKPRIGGVTGSWVHSFTASTSSGIICAMAATVSPALGVMSL